MDDLVLEVKSLTSWYRDTDEHGRRHDHTVLHDVSFTLRRGEILGLVGESGTGKTTLLKLVSGLLFPSQGTVRVGGLDAARREAAFYRELFFVPEEFVLPAITLRRYGEVNAPFYPDFSFRQFGEYLQEFSLECNLRLDRLSMGQRKRVQLAFALACNTPVLLLDEPTNGLDIPSKRVLRKLLAGYADERRTVVVSTHQVRDIEGMIDNVVILDSRGVVLNRTVEEISGRMWFGPVEASDHAIYAEEGIDGLRGILENPAGSDSRPDLEMLFNAAVSEREAVRQLFDR